MDEINEFEFADDLVKLSDNELEILLKKAEQIINDDDMFYMMDGDKYE